MGNNDLDTLAKGGIINKDLDTLAKGGIINKDLIMPAIIDTTDYIPHEYFKPMTTEELIEAIGKEINDPSNSPKYFETLATFNAGSISRTRQGGI